jgi:non-heme chloroperoxidase
VKGSIVCIHGAFAGGWCFERFAAVFKANDWTCEAPDLLGHGTQLGVPGDITSRGLTDYRNELEAYLRTFSEPPVLIGHSMGAVLAQQLAAKGLARALVLISPAPRYGILPSTESEREAAKGFMYLGPFWTLVINPNFDVAAADSLNCLPEAERLPVFERFGPESGQALFELFYWMLDGKKASFVDAASIRCPVLCLSGSEDRVISVATAQATAAAYPQAQFWEIADAGHMLLVEPEAEAIAGNIVAWLAQLPSAISP